MTHRTHKKSSVVAALLFTQLALVGGCLNHPRNGQVQPSKSAAVAFDGYYLDPSQVVHIYILNNVTGAYDPIPHAPIVSAAASQSVKDNGGALWYPFGATDVVLPSGSQYWSAGAAGSFTNVAHVKAIGDNPPDQPITLTTFDVDADSCIDAALQQSGMEALTQCRSAQSPVVTLNATCGASGGDCCLGSSWSACSFGDNCSGSSCTSACGGSVGAACCWASPWCGTKMYCSGQTATQTGSCQSCGAVGQHCCANNSCPTSGACTAGICACGGLGQPCCAVTGCGGTNSGLMCEGGTCQSCGKLGSLCCADNTCAAGGSCVPSTPPQCACGGLNEPCCSGSFCGTNTGYQCTNNVCLAPKQTGPQCSAVGAACGPTQGLAGSPLACCNPTSTRCNYNVCKSCVQHGAISPHPATDICCTYGETPVLDPESGDTVCGIPDSIDTGSD